MFALMRRPVDEEGFTLIETAICIVIVSITAVGMYNAIVVATKYMADSRRNTMAINTARAILEKIADDPNSMEPYSPGMAGLPNMRYEVEYLNDYGAEVLQSQVLDVDPLTIRLTVFWRENPNSYERSVKLSTRITHGLI